MGIGQMDSSKALDADILQCRADILRARQSTASAEIKKHKTEEVKEQARESQVTYVETTQATSANGNPTQPMTEKKKAEIKPNSSTPAQKQTTDIQSNKKETGEAESISAAGKQRDERMPEEAGYSQSNEVKIIKQVKSMISGSEQRGGKEMPRFDLAEQIMAEQRKNSATKRKAPSRKIVSIREQTRDADLMVPSKQEAAVEEKEFPSAQQEIIARIVCRDIERLHKGKGQRGQNSFGDQRF